MGMLRETLLTAIARHLADRPMHIGTAADAIAAAAHGELVVRFSAVDPAVGDASVWIADERFDLGGLVSAAVFVGDVMHDTFDSFDTHLPAPERAARVAGEVARFLRELFEDRLLMWRSVHGRKSAWRERGSAGHLEPLVLDDATYQRYLWSGALHPGGRRTPSWPEAGSPMTARIISCGSGWTTPGPGGLTGQPWRSRSGSWQSIAAVTASDGSGAMTPSTSARRGSSRSVSRPAARAPRLAVVEGTLGMP